MAFAYSSNGTYTLFSSQEPEQKLHFAPHVHNNLMYIANGRVYGTKTGDLIPKFNSLGAETLKKVTKIVELQLATAFVLPTEVICFGIQDKIYRFPVKNVASLYFQYPRTLVYEREGKWFKYRVSGPVPSKQDNEEVEVPLPKGATRYIPEQFTTVGVDQLDDGDEVVIDDKICDATGKHKDWLKVTKINDHLVIMRDTSDVYAAIVFPDGAISSLNLSGDIKFIESNNVSVVIGYTDGSRYLYKRLTHKEIAFLPGVKFEEGNYLA